MFDFDLVKTVKPEGKHLKKLENLVVLAANQGSSGSRGSTGSGKAAMFTFNGFVMVANGILKDDDHGDYKLVQVFLIDVDQHGSRFSELEDASVNPELISKGDFKEIEETLEKVFWG